jgi:hypothetical protein
MANLRPRFWTIEMAEGVVIEQLDLPVGKALIDDTFADEVNTLLFKQDVTTLIKLVSTSKT